MRHSLNNIRLPFIIIMLLIASLACSLTNEENIPEGKLVTDERPAVVMFAPANQNEYMVGSTVTFHAAARDVADGVIRIEFNIDLPGEPVKLIQSAPNGQPVPYLEASVEWQAIGNQTYLVSAVAFRADGTPSNEETVAIKVFNPNPAPTSNNADDSTTSDSTDANSTDSQNADPIAIDTAIETTFDGTIFGQAEVTVRQAPDTASPTVQVVNENDVVQIAGRSEDNLWFVVQVGQGYGYVLQAFVQTTADVSALPVVAAPQ